MTDKQYAVVQNYPKRVTFSKGENRKELLDEYMKERGFYEVPEEQIGTILVYRDGSQKEYICCSYNKYYSKWIWYKTQ